MHVSDTSNEAQRSVQDLCLVSQLVLVRAVRGQEGEQRLWCLGRVGAVPKRRAEGWSGAPEEGRRQL